MSVKSLFIENIDFYQQVPVGSFLQVSLILKNKNGNRDIAVNFTWLLGTDLCHPSPYSPPNCAATLLEETTTVREPYVNPKTSAVTGTAPKMLNLTTSPLLGAVKTPPKDFCIQNNGELLNLNVCGPVLLLHMPALLETINTNYLEGVKKLMSSSCVFRKMEVSFFVDAAACEALSQTTTAVTGTILNPGHASTDPGLFNSGVDIPLAESCKWLLDTMPPVNFNNTVVAAQYLLTFTSGVTGHVTDVPAAEGALSYSIYPKGENGSDLPDPRVTGSSAFNKPSRYVLRNPAVDPDKVFKTASPVEFGKLLERTLFIGSTSRVWLKPHIKVLNAYRGIRGVQLIGLADYAGQRTKRLAQKETNSAKSSEETVLVKK